MDQAEYKEILGMINSVTKFFDFRLVDEQGSHFNSLGVVLLGVHAGVDGLLDHCDLEVEEGGSWRKVWFVFFWIKHIFIFHLNAKHQIRLGTACSSFNFVNYTFYAGSVATQLVLRA